MKTTPSYFRTGPTPSWRLTVTILYLRVRQARAMLAQVAAEFGPSSCTALQARAVLTEATSALDTARQLPGIPAARKWPTVP